VVPSLERFDKHFNIPSCDQLKAPIFVFGKLSQCFDDPSTCTCMQTVKWTDYDLWQWRQLQVEIECFNNHDHAVEVYWLHDRSGKLKVIWIRVNMPFTQQRLPRNGGCKTFILILVLIPLEGGNWVIQRVFNDGKLSMVQKRNARFLCKNASISVVIVPTGSKPINVRPVQSLWRKNVLWHVAIVNRILSRSR
jgi:hypothetical protein